MTRPDDSISRTATLAILMQHAGKLLDDRLRVGFERIGLHPSQGQVLHLLEWGDGVGQRELAAKLKIAAPTVSGILKRMEAAELIERRGDVRDERVVRIFLTRKGRQKSEAARTVVNEVEQVLVAGLTRTELRTAHKLLRRLRNHLGGEPPGPELSLHTIVP